MFKNQSVLITGPTSGLGRIFSELFAEDGAHLVLVSRNEERLLKLKEDLKRKFSIEVKTLGLDLSEVGSSERLLAYLKEHSIIVDVLVNNAGYGVYGRTIEEDLKAQVGMVQLHITTPLELIHALLPGMIQRHRGGILNVASTGGFQAVPLENVYCASKAFMVHFTEALAEEHDKSGVKITCLCPGPTETEFFSSSFMKRQGKPAKMPRMDAEKVCREGFEAFKRGKVLVIPGLSNKLMAFSIRLAPRFLVRKAAKRMMEQPS